ncbi:3-oxoacyl-[acyl-carrier-protein] reductase [Proteiniclasticum sp. QWL-01]|uniref:3-oxoacyl-[acyl-carrier-protein] reductase n=1 Tax=Proteiniclasticum sp. QWL-01 TaxID=3036945 RepID=UPI00220825F4|nr:3-oxoacyl-[acyl-carrier-protein] reductase [Proteiniclasticum sp. QWL-01]UUM13043.1 3-oxoacyl-[acyl-carrier-protein] reductase [Clostridiaceae bacterium HFYG-1003]WFF71468.1 3-oxoacyl-[acyl-carrier-protein] reductase [Proteiniclasticum sp. QWL-01]
MFKDQVVLVTGGSRGIGLETAKAFHREGARVAIIHSGRELPQEVRDLLSDSFREFACDVSDFAAAGETVAEVVKVFGTIDVLINCAGITRDGLMLSMKEADFDQVIDVNLKGTFNFMKHLYPILMKKRSGKIINLSSIVGLKGNKGQANYAASKAGVLGLTKSVAMELASRNINVNAIAPGFIETDMTQNISEKAKEEMVGAIPMKRKGTPADVAKACLFLASDAASYITGQVLVIDGGLSL